MRETRSLRTVLEERRDDPRPAFVEGATGASIGWSDLLHRSDQWRASGLPAGSRVGLVVGAPLQMAADVLGAITAGLTVAPLDPGAPGGELAAKCRTIGLAAVVAGGPEADRAAAVRDAGTALWVSGTDGIVPVEPEDTAPEGPSGRGASIVLATSGTTGRPKLIPLTEAQLMHTAAGVVAVHGLTSEDRGYSPLPLSHINGLVVGLLATAIGGHRLVVDRRFSASGFWDVVASQGVTWCNLVPAIISVLSARPAPDPGIAGQVRFARSASAPLPLATLERFEAATGIPVIETYGMTEAGSQIAANPPYPDRRAGTVGRPVALDLRIVDKDRRRLPPGQIGDIEIRGDNVVEWYWEAADAAEPDRPARQPDGWLRTGDLGQLDAEGYLTLTGRADDVINRGGEKLYPREVEEVLLQEPDVAQAAVVARPHPTVGEEPVAFVLAADGVDRAELLDRLTARCEEALSRFRRPAEIFVVDRLPSGTNGKIRRAELRRTLAGAPGRGSR